MGRTEGQAIEQLCRTITRLAHEWVQRSAAGPVVLKLKSHWREREPKVDGLEYLLLDEAQFIRDWGTWVKHQVDFNKQRRIAFTGSAMPAACSTWSTFAAIWR